MAEASGIFEAAEPAYAVAGDFCKIFSNEMNGLYRLAFLLTADGDKAERCFASGLDDCVKETRVFKAWARSWARRAVIQNAIQMMQPIREQKGHSPTRLSTGGGVHGANDALLAAVAGLDSFERFVYVMSVLEGYSDQECKILLGCSRGDVVRSRHRALGNLATAAEGRVPEAAFNTDRITGHALFMAKTA